MWRSRGTGCGSNSRSGLPSSRRRFATEHVFARPISQRASREIGRDLGGYYSELATHPHHNFYEGREDADLTRRIEYFVKGLAHVFRVAREEALRYAERGVPPEPEMVRRLDQRARRVLALFGTRAEIAAADVRSILPLGDRMVRNLLAQWVDGGLLVVLDSSNRARSYGLSAKYRQDMKA